MRKLLHTILVPCRCVLFKKKKKKTLKRALQSKTLNCGSTLIWHGIVLPLTYSFQKGPQQNFQWALMCRFEWLKLANKLFKKYKCHIGMDRGVILRSFWVVKDIPGKQSFRFCVLIITEFVLIGAGTQWDLCQSTPDSLNLRIKITPRT